MNKLYYVNPTAQSTGEHEVHEGGCYWLAKVYYPVLLGSFANCHEAFAAARSRGYKADGCYYCCRECHSR